MYSTTGVLPELICFVLQHEGIPRRRTLSYRKVFVILKDVYQTVCTSNYRITLFGTGVSGAQRILTVHVLQATLTQTALPEWSLYDWFCVDYFNAQFFLTYTFSKFFYPILFFDLSLTRWNTKSFWFLNL